MVRKTIALFWQTLCEIAHQIISIKKEMSNINDIPIHNVENGPTLILAGPGTGKTHSMALRVKWLVQENNIDPLTITVMTFTAEAALNMRHRLSDEEKPDVFLQRDQQPAQISTMHSLGLQIISNNF